MSRRRHVLVFALLTVAPLLLASDHADPIDPFNLEPEEGGITDLFAFPTTAAGRPIVEGVPTSPDDHLAVILCVHRSLTDPKPSLQGYTYTVNLDLTTSIEFANPASPDPEVDQHAARYGGYIRHPETIRPSWSLAITFPDGVESGKVEVLPREKQNDVQLWSGVRDDPFIFPQFFHRNVVAMVMRIPLAAFPPGQRDFVLWATSHHGRSQIDHVGRSLRTQNPRFELLNTLEPRWHKAALEAEQERPALMRDLFVRLGLNSIYGYRKDWDFAPDVMIYSRREPVGYPNGRRLTDDVANLLARYGDTLLYELSFYPEKQWPRRTENDKAFLGEPPYLAEKWPDPSGEPVLRLAPSSLWKLAAIAVAVVAFLALVAFLGALYAERRRRRRQYL